MKNKFSDQCKNSLHDFTSISMNKSQMEESDSSKAVDHLCFIAETRHVHGHKKHSNELAEVHFVT